MIRLPKYHAISLTVLRWAIRLPKYHAILWLLRWVIHLPKYHAISLTVLRWVIRLPKYHAISLTVLKWVIHLPKYHATFVYLWLYLNIEYETVSHENNCVSVPNLETFTIIMITYAYIWPTFDCMQSVPLNVTTKVVSLIQLQMINYNPIKFKLSVTCIMTVFLLSRWPMVKG